MLAHGLQWDVGWLHEVKPGFPRQRWQCAPACMHEAPGMSAHCSPPRQPWGFALCTCGFGCPFCLLEMLVSKILRTDPEWAQSQRGDWSCGNVCTQNPVAAMLALVKTSRRTKGKAAGISIISPMQADDKPLGRRIGCQAWRSSQASSLQQFRVAISRAHGRTWFGLCTLHLRDALFGDIWGAENPSAACFFGLLSLALAWSLDFLCSVVVVWVWISRPC